MLLHLALSFLVCKFTSRMNFLFVVHFMSFKCFYFVLFGAPDTGFAQLQVCISFIDYWRIVYGHEVPSVSLCLISYHSTSALQLVSLPFKLFSFFSSHFSTLHYYAKSNISVDLYRFGSTLRFLRDRKPEYFTISVLQDKEK